MRGLRLSRNFGHPIATTVGLQNASGAAAVIIGEYVGRIYGVVKRRPLYFVRERFGFTLQGDGDPALPPEQCP